MAFSIINLGDTLGNVFEEHDQLEVSALSEVWLIEDIEKKGRPVFQLEFSDDFPQRDSLAFCKASGKHLSKGKRSHSREVGHLFVNIGVFCMQPVTERSAQWVSKELGGHLAGALEGVAVEDEIDKGGSKTVS